MHRSERFWDRRSIEYDRHESKHRQDLFKTIENAKKHLNASDIVLDYACGTGIITNEIADNVQEIHAIDISSKMIEVAERRAGEREIGNIHYAQSTIFDERYGEASFDVILAFSILHLLEDTRKVMQRISELLKPGGLFISATPCMGEKKSFLGVFFFLLSRTGIAPYMKFLKFSELESMIANGHFRIVEVEDLHQTPPNYFMVARKIERT
jgi:2-polyprenyl-3-methyl-5-hydroxy-6-metoxy-1,4-benzoquinol methylase